MFTRISFILTIAAFPIIFLSAQIPPINDDCNNPIVLPESRVWCSDTSAFSNIGATIGTPPVSVCFDQPGKDVWFAVKALAVDMLISVNTASNPPFEPEISLYKGGCGPDLEEMPCLSDYPSRGIFRDLTIGETYLVRVQGQLESEGSFQLCLYHHNIPPQFNSDCASATLLCDKSIISVPALQGNGELPDEAGGTCLAIVSPSETNSTWFTWTCETSGSLLFILRPMGERDDLDFVLFELPDGTGNCQDKTYLRCMASGDFLFPSPCMGPTGLADYAVDVSEPAGCAQAVPQDNFVSPVNMIAGKSYALVVNNITSGYNGYYLEFAGTGTFRGPDIDFRYYISDSLCTNNTVIFDENTSFPGGTILNTVWNFGTGAIPQSATGPGPHEVIYSFPGIKSVSMTQQTESGCEVTIVKQIGCDTIFTGINELTIPNTSLHIFPNPSSGSFSIYPLEGNDVYARVYDLLGHCLFDSLLTVSDQAATMELAEILPGGIYLLTIEDDLNGIRSGKLVIEK